MYRGENRVKNYLTNSKFDLDVAFGITADEIRHEKIKTQDRTVPAIREEPVAEDVLKKFVPKEMPQEINLRISANSNWSDQEEGEVKTSIPNEDLVTLAQSILDIAKSIKA